VIRVRSAVGARHTCVAGFAVISMVVAGALLLVGCDLLSGRSTGTASVQPTRTIDVPKSTVPTLAGAIEPPAIGALLGVYRPPAPFDMTALDSYAGVSSKSPAILMWYQSWAELGPHEFDPAACFSVFQRGAIPMISWEPWDPGNNANLVKDPVNQPAFRLSTILDGTWDEYIRTFARRVKSVRGPVMIRLMHEMNGNWYPWAGTVNGNTPAQFVAAWRHVHDVFDEEGASNVTWVWSVNHESVPDTPKNAFAAYYPGDAYVDWVAMSGFNWGTSRPRTSWHAFEFWYRKPLAYLGGLHKPIVIAELGCVEDGGDKAAWITDAYARIRTSHPEVKAVIYFDSREEGLNGLQDWRIMSSDASAQAFRAAVSFPYYLSGPAPTLSRWTSGLSATDLNYMRSLPPVY